MISGIDRADIQGNVLIPYGRNTFPMGNLLLFHVNRKGHADRVAQSTRAFLSRLLPQVTTAEFFASKRTKAWSGAADSRFLRPAPPIALNVAFTSRGLESFGVPQTTLRDFPVEFLEGMKARAPVLHDDLAIWDPVWKEEDHDGLIDLVVILRANMANSLAKTYRSPTYSSRTRPHKAGYHPPEVFQAARDLTRRRLDSRSRALIRLAAAHDLSILQGHGSLTESSPVQSPWQFMESLHRSRREGGQFAQEVVSDLGQSPDDLRYSEYEHFGYFDGISDPVFEGQYPDAQELEEVIGQGRREQGSWHPLATGEFLLGYPDEAREMPPGPVPFSFTRNGTFLVVRKLHQQVDCFERTIAEQLPAFQAWLAQQKSASTTAAIGSSHHAEAYSLLRAKLLGRWDDGTPLVLAPTYADWQAFQMEHSRLIAAADADPAAREELLLFRRRFRDFSFEPSDRDGSRCPMTSHIRRSNPRDSDDPRLSDQPTLEERQLAGSVLVNRRRILRRGLPYGERWQRCEAADDPVEACQDDGKERGVVFMALCVGIFRQFEFIQQQWLNYGSDFNAGNDVCPIAGVQGPRQTNWSSKLVIGGAEDGSQPPFIVRPAEAVHCRGGAYFFVPSLAALRLMAQGLIDPI